MTSRRPQAGQPTPTATDHPQTNDTPPLPTPKTHPYNNPNIQPRQPRRPQKCDQMIPNAPGVKK